MMERKKVYLGDGAYAEWDGWNVVVSTERSNGRHYVALEPEVMIELIRFAEKAYPGITKDAVPAG